MNESPIGREALARVGQHVLVAFFDGVASVVQFDAGFSEVCRHAHERAAVVLPRAFQRSGS